MVLLVSQEEGGFARGGFWLEGLDGRRELFPAGYVEASVEGVPALVARAFAAMPVVEAPGTGGPARGGAE